MKDFIDELSNLLKIENRDLIEIDLLLNKIFLELSQNKFICDNFLFKGGTCLIKCYFGYYRFSEDIDLTWKNQDINKNKTGKQLSRDLSEIADKIGEIFEEICSKVNLEFKFDKNDTNFFEFGGSNKMLTLKLWFNSEILKIKKFIKIQINFVECLRFKPTIGKLKSIIPKNRELEFLYPKEYDEYSRDIEIPVYNIKEILCEKVRAILTRQGSTKARDYLDIFFILNRYNFDIKKLKNKIIEKTLFALKLYKKYKQNLNDKRELINSGNLFNWGDEKRYLLKKIDDNSFKIFLDQFNHFLKNLTDEILDNVH